MTVEPMNEANGTPRVLRAAGELEVGSVPRILPRIPELVGGATGVVLDLTEVTFLDSAGVRLVDRLGQECSHRQIPFRVVVPPDHRARRILEIVGFGPPMVADDLPAGLAAVRAAAS